jgi:hypothetical protein
MSSWHARLRAVAARRIFREAGGAAEVVTQPVSGGGALVVRLRGLTRAMATHFYEARKPQRVGPPRPKAPRPPAPQYLTARGARVLGARGSLRGTVVHEHVHHLWLYRANEAAFRALHPDGAHPWALRVLQDMLDRQWHPLECEYAVHSAALQLWTKLDLVAVDTATGRLIVIELKTGYAGGRWDAIVDGRWRRESRLRHLPCNPKHRAMVQAMLGALLLARTLELEPEEPLPDVWVAQVNDETGVTWTHVPPALVDAEGAHLYGVLAERAAGRPLV